MDIALAATAVILARAFTHSSSIGMLSGLAAMAGHNWSIFLKFKGGKGIATGLGVFLALAPLSAILSLLVFLAAVYKWRYISLGSLAATAAFPVFESVYGIVKFLFFDAGLFDMHLRFILQRQCRFKYFSGN